MSRAVFESCDLEAGYLEQWSPNVREGRVNVPLESGGNYYFIDSAVGGCSAGRKLSVRNRFLFHLEMKCAWVNALTIFMIQDLSFLQSNHSAHTI